MESHLEQALRYAVAIVDRIDRFDTRIADWMFDHASGAFADKVKRDIEQQQTVDSCFIVLIPAAVGRCTPISELFHLGQA